MIDVAIIERCASPELGLSVARRFVAQAGSDNPLAVSITSGNRVILPAPPTTQEEAMRLIAHFVSQAVVRVGITSYPAGYGVTDVVELDPGIVDACTNIQLGTALFAKVLHIVERARNAGGNEMFEVAVSAWKTGIFDGSYVFAEADPGPWRPTDEDPVTPRDERMSSTPSSPALTDDTPTEPDRKDREPAEAGIRVDLSGISGQQ